MAGPIENMENIYKKTYKYTPPSPPANLIDCTTFFIDSNIFINIGLDPDFLFNCVIYISNNSQCVEMSIEFYKSLINIALNYINFSRPSHLMLKELKLASVDKYNGDNVLSIKCLQQDQHVRLTKENVSRILQLNDAVEEVIHMKNIYTRPSALRQACDITMYLGKEMPLPKDTKISNVEYYLSRIDVQELKKQLNFTGNGLIADLKIKAVKQLARGWLASSIEIESEVTRPRTRGFVARETAKAARTLIFR